jgi:protease YdgD
VAIALLLAAPEGRAEPLSARVPGVDKSASHVLRIAVFGKDERQPVPPKYQATAESIGVLFNNRTRTVCTAFCVGDAVIATAAHCLSAPTGGGSARTGDFMFARAYDQARDLARIDGSSHSSSAQNVLTGHFHLSVRPPIDAAHDWALVRLSRPACANRVLQVQGLKAMELMEAARANRVFQISYHRDYTQWRPAYSKPCTVQQDFDNADWTTIAPDFLEPEKMILHTCDTGGASSGSPMLLDTASGPVVVGINVGTYVQSKLVVQNGRATVRQKAETVANTAVNAAAFAEKIEVVGRAEILASGGAIRSLQQGLRRYRLYSGRLDGAYGPLLREAIEAFEKAHTLPVTGLATRELLGRVNGEDRLPPTSVHHISR